jgi:ribosome-associated protein
MPDSRTPFSDLDPEVKLALHSASEKKATDIVVLDLREIASFTEFFIIASGSNQRQVQAICDEITEQLKAQLSSRPVRVEGYASAEWVLLDYGDFIVHVFNKESREFYDLERLWRDSRRVDLPAEI